MITSTSYWKTGNWCVRQIIVAVEPRLFSAVTSRVVCKTLEQMFGMGEVADSYIPARNIIAASYII